MTDAGHRLESKLGFDRIRTLIADRCSTDYAAQRVAAEQFISDPSAIRRRLQLTDEMRLIVMFEESFPTNGYIDCLPFLTPLLKDGASIDLLSLGKLRTMLETLHKIAFFFRGIKDGIYPNLKRMAAPIAQFPDIQKRIDAILDRYGSVKDNASPELAAIRKSLKDKEGAISRRAAAILRQAQAEGLVDSDAGISIRDGKYLIPVPSGSKRKLDGFIYDESASGKTTFIEPAEVVSLGNEISELHFAEAREISRILREFSDFIRPQVPQLLDGAIFIGEVDFLLAKAQTALDFIAGMPVISEDGEMNLRKARHPLLEKALKKEGRSIMPLTVTLTPRKRILVISGPNAGGKSVCLKTVGLLQYMFQWGMLIPTSEASEMPVFDRIMLSIGDDQSIDNDLSTYSSFLSDMRETLAVADGRTLVLIDEFGSGTEPAAGGAIAEAILAELDGRGVYGVITTHYTNLKLYAANNDSGVTNGAMAFDTQHIAPLFKLEIGLPGNSFAFELARKMGLPETIVKDAEERAGEEYVGIERNLRRIAHNRKVLDERLQKIKHTDKTLESITDKYQKELLDIKQQKKDILDQAKREAADIVKDANKQVENTIRAIKEAQAEREQTKEARKELQGFVSALQDRKSREQKTRDEYIDRKLEQLGRRQEKERERKARREGRNGAPGTPEEQPAPPFRSGAFKVGEKVRIKDNGMVGEISKVSGKSVTLAIGSISSTVPAGRVERISSNEYKAAARQAPVLSYRTEDPGLRDRKLNFKMELDVRGERLTDALDIVTHYVDDALMLSVPSVRIIHGKGTGVLREEIQKYLRTIPGIASVRDEQIQFGGTGVTIVTFE
ncbi:MAG: Smr/MutS family protein [Bacteroidales bacterium]|nr:Smr/MutS family protein [Bacteroidales bacterium]